MKIIYKNNDAAQVPIYMVGNRIEIRNWLLNHSFDTFFKEIDAHIKGGSENKYDDGQGRHYDILDEELQ